MADKGPRQLSGWLVGIAVILLVLGRCYWESSHNEARLLPGGKAVFYRAGIFRREKLDLERVRGKWELFEKGSSIGQDLIVPFESPYNDYKTLRLDAGGRAFLLDKKAMTRIELRVVDGEWSYDASDHWQSIFDLDID